MSTTTTTPAAEGWAVIHDSDPRGASVDISGPNGARLAVPYSLIEELVGGCIGRQIIQQLESATGRGLLMHLGKL